MSATRSPLEAFKAFQPKEIADILCDFITAQDREIVFSKKIGDRVPFFLRSLNTRFEETTLGSHSPETRINRFAGLLSSMLANSDESAIRKEDCTPVSKKLFEAIIIHHERERLAEAGGVLSDPTPVPELKAILEQEKRLDKKIAELGQLQTEAKPPAKDQLNHLIARLQDPTSDKKALKKTLQELDGDFKNEDSLNHLFAENQMNRLFEELQKKNVALSAQEEKRLHREYFTKFLEAKDLGVASTIIKTALANEVSDIAELQGKIAVYFKAFESKDGLKNAQLLSLNTDLAEFSNFLRRLPADKPLPAVITQAALDQWLRLNLEYAFNDKNAERNIAEILKNPVICDRLFIGKTDKEKFAGEKLAASIFAQKKDKDPRAEKMALDGDKIAEIDNKSLILTKVTVYAFLKKRAGLSLLQEDDSPVYTTQTSTSASDVTAAKKIYKTATDIYAQRWKELENYLNLPPNDRPNFTDMGNVKELLTQFTPLFSSPPLPDFIKPTSIVKLFNCYPDFMFRMHSSATPLLIEQLFKSDKEEGTRLTIQILNNMHELWDARYEDKSSLVAPLLPNNRLSLNTKGVLTQDAQIFQTQLLKELLKNKTNAAKEVILDSASGEEDAVGKALLILSLTEHNHNPGGWHKETKDLIEQYAPILESYKQKLGFPEHPDTSTPQVLAELVGTINEEAEICYVRDLNQSALRALLQETNQFWKETETRKNNHSSPQAKVLNLSAKHLSSGELQFLLCGVLIANHEKEFSPVDRNEITKALLITSMNYHAKKISLSSEKADILSNELKTHPKYFVQDAEKYIVEDLNREVKAARAALAAAQNSPGKAAEAAEAKKNLQAAEEALTYWKGFSDFILGGKPNPPDLSRVSSFEVTMSYLASAIEVGGNKYLADQEKAHLAQAAEAKRAEDARTAETQRQEAERLAKESEAKRATQEEQEKKVMDEANQAAAVVFRKYIEETAKEVPHSKVAREELNKFGSFFSESVEPQYKELAKQLSSEPSQVKAINGTGRKILTEEELARSESIPKIIENVSASAKVSEFKTLQKGQVAINWVEQPGSKSTKDSGCYLAHYTTDGHYLLSNYQLPVEIRRLPILMKILGSDAQHGPFIREVFKDYKEAPPTKEGIRHFLLTKQRQLELKNDEIGPLADNILTGLRNECMKPIPGTSRFVPNALYVDYVNNQMTGFIDGAGTSQPLTIYQNDDPLLAMTYLLVCKAKNIPCVNKTGLPDPHPDEIKFVAERVNVSIPVDSELKELKRLKGQVSDPAKINALEKLVEKAGSGVLLDKKDADQMRDVLESKGPRR